MSTYVDTPPTSAESSRTTQSAVLAWIGAAIATVGVVIAIAGGAILGVFGTDGRLSTGPETVTTATTALVTEAAALTDTAGAAEVLGRTSVSVSADALGDHGVFVGIARTADVDRYLAGAGVDKITDFDVDPFVLTRDTRPGTATPAPPADQSFWVARSTGRASAAIDWEVRDGSYRLVVMNADGSPRVNTQAKFAVTVPNLPTIMWGVLGGGLLIALGGLTALTVGLRPRQRQRG